MNKIIVLGGATAVGKTALAIHWARTFGGEIINADSRQIYRYMDIGTAKPTPEEQAQATHHLIDLVTPNEVFTLAQFQAAAYQTIDAILGRGRIPILAGGTGLYLTAIMEGWQVPQVEPDPILRAELESLSTAELFQRFLALDPDGAAHIDRHNPRRLVRAIEVCLSSGQPFSVLRQKHPPDYNPFYAVLTMEREALYARADARTALFLERGWLDEIRQLGQKGYDQTKPALTAVGYPQLAAHLRGESSLADAITDTHKATHHFIRRQLTWLRGHDTGWWWFTPDQSETVTQAIGAWLAS